MLTWTTLERPGYFGSKRDAIFREYDLQYGFANWRIAWVVNDHVITREEGVMVYEDAYYEFFKTNPDVLAQLVETAYDVYDDALTNVDSGLDYTSQETDRTHLQDIAIRRCVLRLGARFHGTSLLRIRDKDGLHPLSLTLSPGQVPFHHPEWIVRPALTGWWAVDSVESFYQSNKVLQVLKN